jgi:hypothetical protein
LGDDASVCAEDGGVCIEIPKGVDNLDGAVREKDGYVMGGSNLGDF